LNSAPVVKASIIPDCTMLLILIRLVIFHSSVVRPCYVTDVLT